jgi:hypothetical protein
LRNSQLDQWHCRIAKYQAMWARISITAGRTNRVPRCAVTSLVSKAGPAQLVGSDNRGGILLYIHGDPRGLHDGKGRVGIELAGDTQALAGTHQNLAH